MKLYKIQLNKDDLRTIPKEELLFFIQLTNFANEIFCLQKITFFSVGVKEKDLLIRRAKNSQALFLIKLTAGKLWEAWRLLETHFHNTDLARDYYGRFSEETKKNYEYIKQYFSQSNLIKLTRDKYAFHYDSETSKKVEEVFDALNNDEIFDMYISEHHGNCFYDMSDALINASLLSSIDESDRENAMLRLLTEVKDVTKNFLHFVGECVLVFGKRHLHFEPEEIEIPDQPSLEEGKIPYFVEPPDDYQIGT